MAHRINVNTEITGTLKLTDGNATIMGDVTGNARGANALDIQSVRFSATQVASGSNSIAVGIRNTVSGDYGCSASGYKNTASGYFTSASGYNNTASVYSSSASGYQNIASATNSSAFGYKNTINTGSDDSTIVGASNIVAINTTNATIVGKSITNSTANSVEIGPSNTAKVSITSDGAVTAIKAKITALGGMAILLTNTTGNPTVKGQVVEVDSTTDDAVIVAVSDSDAPIGVFLDAGVADDAEAWVVVSGRADVLADDVGFTRGDRLIASGNVVGTAEAWNVGGAVATHTQEIGHAIETAAANVLGRCILHFN